VSVAALVLGRREPRRARADLVGGIAAARLTLEVQFDLRVRAAALAFEPLARPPGFDELLGGIAEDTGAVLRRHDDGFGYTWVMLSGGSLDDLAISIGVLAESLHAGGCWEQLICAVFAFERRAHSTDARIYWIYNFARGGFYAFVPRGDFNRDSAEELRLHESVSHDLRLEPDPQCWYPLWRIPI
jgi:hypothetical protein